MPATAEDRRTAERVCLAASGLGIHLRMTSTRFGHSFCFLLPNGQEVPGRQSSDRQVALANACRDLLPHIFSHL